MNLLQPIGTILAIVLIFAGCCYLVYRSVKNIREDREEDYYGVDDDDWNSL